MQSVSVSRRGPRQRAWPRRLSALVLLAAFLTATLAPPARASMEGELDRFLRDWEAQLTVTRPGFYEGQRRGFMTGGAMSLRFPRRSITPFTLSLPRVKAGCGGISLFGGAFSFINMEQFTQYLQGIMQNAVGVAFDMALTTLCPQCSKVLSNMEAAVRQVGAGLTNSCENAKRLLHALAPDNINQIARENCAAIDTFLGAVPDFFKGKVNCEQAEVIRDADLRAKTRDAQNPTEYPMRISHNVFWNAWDKVQGVTPFWDAAFGETLMSITGTIVLNYSDPDQQNPTLVPHQPTLTVDNLLAGWVAGGVSLLKCQDDQFACLKVGVADAPSDYDGFEALVEESLIRYATDLESRSRTVPGALLRTPVAGMPLARLLGLMTPIPGGADYVVGMSKRVIAAGLLDELLTRAIRLVRQEVTRHGNDPTAKQFLEELRETEKKIRGALGARLQEMTQVNQNLQVAVQLAQLAQSQGSPSLMGNLGFAARMSNPMLQGNR
jgi:conjugative transfer pilus assembly protein TraH